jgi:predicted fused transcriptional regulator/phosphomethylpyrimidine kinase
VRKAVPDQDTEVGLRRYIAACEVEDAYLRSQIDAVVDRGRPVIVWGVGTHTTRLLATSRLAEANIRAFVDSNVRYQNRELNGVRIISPAALRNRPEPILVSSRVFQNEIEEQIRRDLGLSNELILLYKLP